MLEPVVLHQTRFNAPGLAPDPRGIALGKEGAVLVPSLDALVGWFRVLSDEISLDDLLPSLKIHEVEGAVGSRELLVRFDAASSHLCDRASRIAALVGGLCFTGSGRHLVKYRDAAAPLGYDVAPSDMDRDLERKAPHTDVILHAPAFTQGYHLRREIPFAQLVFRLSPRRMPGTERTPESDREERALLWLLVEPGLSRSVLGYLFRNRVQGEAVMVARLGPASSFDAATGTGANPTSATRRMLVRVHDLPARVRDLFTELPGVTVFRPVDGAANLVVEAGYRHPLRLESCLALFDRRFFYVFAGASDAVEVLTEGVAGVDLAASSGEHGDDVGASRSGDPLPLASIDRLVSGDFKLDRAEVKASGWSAPERLRITLRLVPSGARAPSGSVEGNAGSTPRGVAGLLVPWERAEWLKRLVFALPPTLVASCRVASIDEGLLIIASVGGGTGAVDRLPLGELLYEAAPSILVPVGYELSPRVTPEVLAELVGGTGGRQLVLRHEKKLTAIDSKRAADRGSAPDSRGAAPPRGEIGRGETAHAIAVDEALFEPLSRRLLGPISVEPRLRDPRLPAVEPARAATVTNDSAGPFPLWGYQPPGRR